MESVFLATAIVGLVELIKAVNTSNWETAELIVGLVELIKAVNTSNWETAELIVGAALIGLLCGVFHVDNLTIVTGIQAGLVAAGTYKVGSLIGGK